MSHWEAAINALLLDEGGESRRPETDDPGGWTRYGITLNRWLAEGGEMDAFERTTAEDAEQWYLAHVWRPLGMDRIDEERIAILLFNWAAGPLGEPRAVRCLQEALNRLRSPEVVNEDGILGPITARATNEYPHTGALAMVIKLEVALYLASRPHWAANRNGWMNRLDRL